ncbi:polymerase [Mesorhizobium sp. dw_380]|uniref:polymerase n=1 Tax=Mesorhizobium sp. dw_380 TaxID=2812001 RepID=UPI001BDED7CD|nr:polymerase [Mesorhizobium sp. dw_380]
MQFGEIIANILTATLLICVLAIVLFLFGSPLWPEPKARMVIILPAHAMTTGSVRTGTNPRLPQTFDIKLALPRPQLQ